GRGHSQAVGIAGGTAARAAVGAVGASATQAPGSAAAQGAPRKRTGLIVGVLAALALIGGAAAVVLSQKKPPVTPAPESPKPVAKVEAPAAPPKPVEPAKPTEFTQAINTTPAGAEVFVGPERLGLTPFNVKLPAGTQVVE